LMALPRYRLLRRSTPSLPAPLMPGRKSRCVYVCVCMYYLVIPEKTGRAVKIETKGELKSAMKRVCGDSRSLLASSKAVKIVRVCVRARARATRTHSALRSRAGQAERRGA
jgi:hypothetical protein